MDHKFFTNISQINFESVLIIQKFVFHVIQFDTITDAPKLCVIQTNLDLMKILVTLKSFLKSRSFLISNTGKPLLIKHGMQN